MREAIIFIGSLLGDCIHAERSTEAIIRFTGCRRGNRGEREKAIWYGHGNKMSWDTYLTHRFLEGALLSYLSSSYDYRSPTRRRRMIVPRGLAYLEVPEDRCKPSTGRRRRCGQISMIFSEFNCGGNTIVGYMSEIESNGEQVFIIIIDIGWISAE